MSVLVGTAGHVDHGKTTLIRALTGIDADRLPEEKQRGLTIDIGFAWMDLPDVGRVSIVDVPGHERFVTNMLVGALAMDVAILCVAGDEGVMPQTREHMEILELLPVQRLIVALTKCDLLEPDWIELAQGEVAEWLKTTRFAESLVLPVSASSGQGLEELKAALVENLKQVQQKPSGPWRLPVDRVFTVKGHGAVVTGSLIGGSVSAGDQAALEPGGKTVRVKSLQSHGEDAASLEPGRRVAMNLSGVKAEEVERGMLLGKPGSIVETSLVDLTIRWKRPLRHAERVRLAIGADDAVGRAYLNDHEPDLVQVKLDRPVGAAKGLPVVLRRHSPPDILGGGQVAVPVAKRRRKSERVKTLSGEGGVREQILEVIGAGSYGADTDAVAGALGQTRQALGDVFEALLGEGEIVGFAGHWMTSTQLGEAEADLRRALQALHDQTPEAALLPRESVLAQAGLPLKGKPLDRFLAHLADSGSLRVKGTQIALADHRPRLKEAQQRMLDRVRQELDAGGLNVPSVQEITQKINVPPQAIEQIVRLGLDAGFLVRVADGLYYTPESLTAIQERMRSQFGESPFAASDLRDAFDTSRKYAIPLLEHFDSVGFTKRMGDKRKLV